MLSLKYKMSCLNCLHTDGLIHSFNWATEEKDFLWSNTQPIYSKEFLGIYSLKEEFYDRKMKCQFCDYPGAFDIWDLKINGEKAYKELDYNSNKMFRIQMDKTNNKIISKYSGSSDYTFDELENFFTASKRFTTGINKNLSISKAGGVVDIIVYSPNDSTKIYFNRFRYSGFSKEEIEGEIDNIRIKIYN